MKSCSPEPCTFLVKLSSITPASSTPSLTGACWAMVLVYMSYLTVNSTSFPVLGKSAFCMPQAKIAGAVLAIRTKQKISQELSNVSLSTPIFIRDLEIILKMIAKNNPASPPVFYGTRLMEISAASSADCWFWCLGPLNPADLLTRTCSTCDQIKSDFWLHGSILPQPRSSWPIKKCASLPVGELPTRTINLTTGDQLTHPLTISSVSWNTIKVSPK